MNEKQNSFRFDRLPDIISPKDMINANWPGGRNQLYNLFNSEEFPAIRHGKKLLVSKVALQRYFQATEK
ncbi:MAG TPA: hypothetical protein PKN87_10005 [Syntrophomonadaceae bacterium]|nr:hypothetical protein [Syntrophomonadaceae bacterium]HPR92939.1 hypothetical protein [Syntrophomonadaceae bacterium]